MEEEAAEAARQRAGGRPMSEWARRQTDEIRQVRDDLRALRREAYVAEGPMSGGDGFNHPDGRAPARNRHNRPLSAVERRRLNPGSMPPTGSPAKERRRGAGSPSSKPRWLVPARSLNNKERLTSKEQEFQQELAERRGAGPQENLSVGVRREQALRDALLPWWERSEKEDKHRTSANKLSAGGWYPGKPRDGSSSPIRHVEELASPSDMLKARAKQPKAFSDKQVAAHRAGPVDMANLAEQVALDS